MADLPLLGDELRRRLALERDRQLGIDPGAGNDRGYAFNQWLPVSTNKVGSASWVQQGADPKLAVPEALQGGLLGGADLLDSPRTGKLTPEALGSLLTGSTLSGGLLAPRGSLAAGGSIKAYHGSPHDFDRFDASKIGMGEGAQAYGHGLYFAENEGVARGYRDALGGDAIDLGGKKVMPTPGSSEDMALAWLRSAPQDAEPFAAARRSLRSTRDAPEATPAMKKKYDDALKVLDDWQLAGGKPTAGGHMYEVNIKADPQKFLNYDKPLTEQHPIVQQAVDEMWGKPTPGMTGEHFLRKELGDPNEVSAILQEQGVPGVRYLDQGSRAAGTGTSNYVVFPTQEEIIEILRKYGLAAPSPVVPGAQGAPTTPGLLSDQQSEIPMKDRVY